MAESYDRARLRGPDTVVESGVRAVARLATTDCPRHRTVIAAGTAPEHLVTRVYGARPDDISPFAAEAGSRFEADLFTDGATRLVELYRRAGILGAGAVTVEMIPDEAEPAERRTREILEDLAAGRTVPDIVVQARLGLRVGEAIQGVRPDVMVRPTDAGMYRIGELKSYLDREGRTDGRLIASACRQGAVGLLALCETAGVALPEDPSFELVLRRDAAERARIHTMGIDAELHAITRAIAQVPDLLDAAERVAGESSLLDRRVLEAIPHRYRSSCHGSCAFAQECFAEAWHRGDLSVIGESAVIELENYQDLHEALRAARAGAGDLGRVWTALGLDEAQS